MMGDDLFSLHRKGSTLADGQVWGRRETPAPLGKRGTPSPIEKEIAIRPCEGGIDAIWTTGLLWIVLWIVTISISSAPGLELALR